MDSNAANINRENGEETPVTERVSQFLDLEGDRIRQETERIQSPIIAKARMEYKVRLANFLQEESGKLKAEAENEASTIISRARSEANDILATVESEKYNIMAEARKQAETVIEEAKQQATAERERMVADVQKDVEAIIAEARQNAELIAAEAREAARKTTETDVEKILIEAHKKAHDQSQTIITNSWHRSQQLLDSAESAYKLVRTQLQTCIKAIIEADNTMETIVAPKSDDESEMTLFAEKVAEPEAVASTKD